MTTRPIVPLTKSSRFVIASDVHDGATHHCAKEWAECIRYVLDEKALLLCNGDMADCSIPAGKSVGSKLMGQSKWPNEQVESLCAMLAPVKKAGLLIGFTDGNHDADRPRNAALFNLCEFMALKLEVPYLGIGGYFRFSTGRDVYTTAVQHGTSGAKNPWTQLIQLAKIYPQSELVAMGHIHQLKARVETISDHGIALDKRGSEKLAPRRDVWLVRTGGYLGYADYVRASALTPQPIGSPIIEFGRDEHRINVDTKTLSWGF